MGGEIILRDGRVLKVPDRIDEETRLQFARATVAGGEDPRREPEIVFPDPDAGMEDFDELQSAGIYRRETSENESQEKEKNSGK